MRTADLERNIGRRLRVSRWEVREFLDALSEVAGEALSRGEVVRLIGIGSLRLHSSGCFSFRAAKRLKSLRVQTHQESQESVKDRSSSCRPPW